MPVSRDVAWAFALAFCLASFSLIHQGCGGPPPVTRIVCGSCEAPERLVRLQAHPAHIRQPDQQRFAHPFLLSPEDWKPILAGIQVQNRVQPFLFISIKGEDTPAFTPDEVDYLSATLSRAFAQAHPDEWVVFVLGQPASRDVTEMTTGGWYVEGARLYLVLANFRAAVTMPNVRETLVRDPFYQITGSRPFELAPNDFSQRPKSGGSLLGYLIPEVQQLSIDYQRALTGPSPQDLAAPPAQAAKPGTSAKPGAAPVTPPPSLEDRLESLKRMRDKDLISEEEYRAKKKQLLEGF